MIGDMTIETAVLKTTSTDHLMYEIAMIGETTDMAAAAVEGIMVAIVGHPLMVSTTGSLPDGKMNVEWTRLHTTRNPPPTPPIDIIIIVHRNGIIGIVNGRGRDGIVVRAVGPVGADRPIVLGQDRAVVSAVEEVHRIVLDPDPEVGGIIAGKVTPASAIIDMPVLRHL